MILDHLIVGLDHLALDGRILKAHLRLLRISHVRNPCGPQRIHDRTAGDAHQLVLAAVQAEPSFLEALLVCHQEVGARRRDLAHGAVSGVTVARAGVEHERPRLVHVSPCPSVIWGPICCLRKVVEATQHRPHVWRLCRELKHGEETRLLRVRSALGAGRVKVAVGEQVVLMHPRLRHTPLPLTQWRLIKRVWIALGWWKVVGLERAARL
mmetsp:Transcript_50088/g.100548  ORF Transcript_50088/g.100548 Transcript_50088/m.100548 type:complete len:210 (+) Transcript_50088:200-829(+)